MSEQLADLVNDLRTPVGFLAGGALTSDAIPVEARATLDGGNAYAAARGLLA